MNSIYEKRNNYDLRKLLAGSERLVDFLLKNETHKKISNNPFVPLTHSVRILPMESSIRDSITSTIQSNCAKIKNLVFAVLLANNKLITLVRMKNYSMHTDDLRLIFNLVECTESFKTAEVSESDLWLPSRFFDLPFHSELDASLLAEIRHQRIPSRSRFIS
jgi:vacuolar fusion protein MON1